MRALADQYGFQCHRLVSLGICLSKSFYITSDVSDRSTRIVNVVDFYNTLQVVVNANESAQFLCKVLRVF